MAESQGRWSIDSAQLARAQLDEVLAHPLFKRASRQSAFLRFIVENVLESRTESLREHQIGVEVYGRRQDYDTREDPIVRVEAARLRAKLREYYEGPGSGQAIRFELPKRTYVPLIAGISGGNERTKQIADSEARAAGQGTPGPQALLPPFLLPAGWLRFRWTFVAFGLAALAAATGLVWSLKQSSLLSRDAQLRSVAVLPFQDLSEKQDQEVFCEGLTDQVTDELARVSGLMVAGRSSAGQFRNPKQDLRTIGARLKVTHILEGSVRAAGARVRVSARLVDVQTGFQLWSATLEKSRDDLFSLQDEIARSMAHALQVQLSSRKESEAAARSPQRLKSHNLFLEARALHRKMNPASLNEARRLHEEAVEADPSYALAHSGLAHVYISIMSSGLAPPVELRDRTYAEAKRAVDLDPGLTDGYSALIRLARDIDYDWSSAQQICKDAEGFTNSPGNIMANCGIMDMIQGRYAEAEAHFQVTMKLDPLWPGGAEARANLLAWSGRYREAESQIRTVRSTNPDYVPALYSLARILALQDRFAEGLELFDQRSSTGHALTPGQLALMSYLCAKAGKQPRAKEIERQLRKRSRTERVLQSDLALARLGLNDQQGALALLELSLNEREPSLGENITDPLFLPIREQPRFRALLRRLNL